MSGKLEFLSEPALVRAIEANLFGLFTAFRGWPQAEVHDDPDMLWTITNVPFPLFNSVFRARVEPQNVDAVIEATLRRYGARNVPMLWWTGPTTRPRNLGIYLEAHGLVNEEGDSPGMAVDLQALNEGLNRPLGLEVEMVSDAESLRKWSEVLIAAAPMPEFVARPMFDFCASLGFGKASPVRNYSGRLDGEVVATASTFLGAGVAGIYNVATLPKARRQGIGAAMTLDSLCEARALGYQVGVLISSQLGVGVYRKIGFREYCKIGQYSWTK
ncbi:MAG: GNAT family N-acetyltransferase [Candidatus Bathyarchaeia archaeon]